MATLPLELLPGKSHGQKLAGSTGVAESDMTEYTRGVGGRTGAGCLNWKTAPSFDSNLFDCNARTL